MMKDEKKEVTIFEIAHDLDYATLEKMFEVGGYSADYWNEHGNSLLHFAANHKRELSEDLIKTVNILVEYEANIDGVNKSSNQTVLHYAACYVNWDFFEYLIREQGADFNILDKNEVSPFCYILKKAQEENKIDVEKIGAILDVINEVDPEFSTKIQPEALKILVGTQDAELIAKIAHRIDENIVQKAELSSNELVFLQEKLQQEIKRTVEKDEPLIDVDLTQDNEYNDDTQIDDVNADLAGESSQHSSYSYCTLL